MEAYYNNIVKSKVARFRNNKEVIIPYIIFTSECNVLDISDYMNMYFLSKKLGFHLKQQVKSIVIRGLTLLSDSSKSSKWLIAILARYDIASEDILFLVSKWRQYPDLGFECKNIILTAMNWFNLRKYGRMLVHNVHTSINCMYYLYSKETYYTNIVARNNVFNPCFDNDIKYCNVEDQKVYLYLLIKYITPYINEVKYLITKGARRYNYLGISDIVLFKSYGDDFYGYVGNKEPDYYLIYNKFNKSTRWKRLYKPMQDRYIENIKMNDNNMFHISIDIDDIGLL